MSRPAPAGAGAGDGGSGAEDGDAPSAPAVSPVRVAVVDVGSNSIRLVVADVTVDGRLAPVEDYKFTPRLGAGLHATGTLAPTAVQRALLALADMAARARELRADVVVAVATSAVREAADGAAFVRRVRAETGLALRALDGEEEARLAWRSAAARFELGAGRVAVADIGGGSLELALATGGAPERVASFPLGAIRLTERFLRDGADAARVTELRATVGEALRAALPLDAWRGGRLIGSGGTFTSLGAMQRARLGLSPVGAVHATAVPRADVESLLDRLWRLGPEARARVPGLRPSRADIVVAGLAVAAEAAACLDAAAVEVSAYGIREGLLLEGAETARRLSARGPAAR